MAHQEDPYSADEKCRSHDNKADPVNHPGDQKPLLILLRLKKRSSEIITDADLNMRT